MSRTVLLNINGEEIYNSGIDSTENKKKGKCYSKVNKGQRKESDFYQTPYSMTKQLLDNEFFSRDAWVLEPACGNGAILKVLKESGFIYCVDLDINKGCDFLKTSQNYDYIITNPPFSLANDFIEHCYAICKNKFALLMPLVYLHGQKRFEQGLFRGLSKVYVFTRMPMLTSEVRKDGKYNTGMQVYAWFIFENKLKEHGPEIKWIDNSMYVLKKGE